jgi:hypothetical protein
MSAAEIKELAGKELAISRATVERLLRNAVNRGALVKTARGKYVSKLATLDQTAKSLEYSPTATESRQPLEVF